MVTTPLLQVTSTRGEFETPKASSHGKRTVAVNDAGRIHGKRTVAVNDAGRIIGQDHPNAKLTDHEVDLIITLRADGMSLREIADKFDISLKTVSNYCTGRRRGQVAVAQQPLGRPRTRRPTHARGPARPSEFD